jgi:hypothetical protein
VQLADAPVSTDSDITGVGPVECPDDGPRLSHDPLREWLAHPRATSARHRQERERLSEEALVHHRSVERILAEADFESFHAFYERNEARRGDDIALARFADGELIWSVCWLPRTTEVVAFAVAWAETRWHENVRVTESFMAVQTGLSPERIPELVFVLGHAETSDRAGSAIEATNRDLASIRAALASAP